MEQYLTQANEVDAVLSQNDGMASGAPWPRVSPARCRCRARTPTRRLNRVALGTQAVSVWKDARELGRAAGEAAVALAQGTPLEEIPGTVIFDSPGGNQMVSILLEPVAITRDNLNLVVEAEWITVDQLCQGVQPGTVEVCG